MSFSSLVELLRSPSMQERLLLLVVNGIPLARLTVLPAGSLYRPFFGGSLLSQDECKDAISQWRAGNLGGLARNLRIQELESGSFVLTRGWNPSGKRGVRTSLYY
jgi:hypothetical protein